MIEGMLANTLLVLGVVMLILVLNFRFRKHSRLLLWIEGLVSIIGSLLGIGLGWIRLFLPDGYPNFPVLMAVTVVFIAGALFIIVAEKQQKKKKEQTQIPILPEDSQPSREETPVEETTQDMVSVESDEISVLPLKGKLDKPLAWIIFKKALETDLMSIEAINEYRSYYHWKGSKVLLAYMCGRIYCGDKSQKLPSSNIIIWKGGGGKFPSIDLGRLFNENNLGQQRANRLDETVPTDFESIDQLFS